MDTADQADFKWLDSKGEILACAEKLRVLEESLADLQQTAQDTFEDGLLIGVSEQQLKDRLQDLIKRLDNPYAGSGSLGPGSLGSGPGPGPD